MSVFTNPIDAAAEEAEAYTKAILELLGGREPLAILESLTQELEGLLAGVDEDVLQRAEAPGKWSMFDVLCHLHDSELVWAYRLRVVLAEERPTLTGYDQDRWVEALAPRAGDSRKLLSELATLRRMNLRLLESCSDRDLERVGRHSERGDESVAHMLRLYAGHDLVHLAQLERIRRAHA